MCGPERSLLSKNPPNYPGKSTRSVIIIAAILLIGEGDWAAETIAGIGSLLFVSELFALKPTFELADLKKKMAKHPAPKKEW